jgi:hypothetical protein
LNECLQNLDANMLHWEQIADNELNKKPRTIVTDSSFKVSTTRVTISDVIMTAEAVNDCTSSHDGNSAMA